MIYKMKTGSQLATRSKDLKDLDLIVLYKKGNLELDEAFDNINVIDVENPFLGRRGVENSFFFLVTYIINKEVYQEDFPEFVTELFNRYVSDMYLITRKWADKMLGFYNHRWSWWFLTAIDYMDGKEITFETINDYYERSKNKTLTEEEKIRMIGLLEDELIKNRLIDSIVG